MKLVIVKADAPLRYKGADYDLLLFGGAEINKVDDALWDKVTNDFAGNITLLQENNVLEVSDSKGSKKANQKVDEEALQDLVDQKLDEQNKRTPKNITNNEQKGEEL